jgi:hypothetical protein
MTTTTFRSLHESPRRFTHKFVVTTADLTEATANTAQNVALITLPANSLLVSAATFLKTPFADASDAAFNSTALIVGDSGDTDRAIASQQLNVNGTEVLAKAHNALPFAYETATVINANFAAMTAKALNDLDVGELHIFLEVRDLTAIS